MKKVGKICSEHPELKGLRYFHKGKMGRCLKCHIEQVNASRRALTGEKRERYLARMRRSASKHHAFLKRSVMDHYGGKCKKCGIEDIDVLTIDHTANNGHSHRKEIGATREAGAGSIKVYRWLIAHGFPKGFGVLCFNHNIKKHLVWMRRQSKN